jgi:signal transduction histidine kinase
MTVATESIKLLLVEDNAGDADLVREWLAEARSIQLLVTHVEELSAAVRASGQQQFDVALLDLSLPDSHGLETLQRMRAACPAVPIVVLTGWQDEEAAVEAVREGAQDYLMKGRLEGLSLSRAIRHAIERKKLEEQLRQAQKMEAVGRLAGGIAHDFNNALTAIIGFSEFLLRDGNLNEPAHNGLEEIRKAGERAATLTRQLLAFSRKQVLRPQVLDLNGIVRDMETMLRRLIGANIDLVTALVADLRPVEADAGSLQQVIMNLVVNARDAMPSGGQVTISTRNVEVGADAVDLQPGSYTVLQVTDTGHGMDEETKTYLFEPFFTTKEVGKGTGLGLAMVYGIVKQSSGRVEVTSAPNQGATFTIFLPSARQLAPSKSNLKPKEVPAPRGKETVLLVEDETSVRRLTSVILTQAGYRVLESCNGREALELCQRQAERIDLLLSDLIMPHLGGQELVRRLLLSRPGLKVLFMSGYNEDLVAGCRTCESIPLLNKPFTTTQLTRAVRTVLDGVALESVTSS